MNDVWPSLDIDAAVAGRPVACNEGEALSIIAFADLHALAGGNLAEKRALAHHVASAAHTALGISIDIDLEGAVADGIAIYESRARAAYGAYPVHY
jgi:hypothetical protein